MASLTSCLQEVGPNSSGDVSWLCRQDTGPWALPAVHPAALDHGAASVLWHSDEEPRAQRAALTFSCIARTHGSAFCLRFSVRALNGHCVWPRGSGSFLCFQTDTVGTEQESRLQTVKERRRSRRKPAIESKYWQPVWERWFKLFIPSLSFIKLLFNTRSCFGLFSHGVTYCWKPLAPGLQVTTTLIIV